MTQDRTTISSLDELPHVAHIDHVILTMEADYCAVISSVYEAAREAGRYVSAGQSYIDGVLIFHLFPKEAS